MQLRDRIDIAKDFSTRPGARYEYEGPYSGEVFLKTLLRPKFERAVAEQHLLEINLDGVIGFPPSFVSGSFGLLSLEKGSALLLKHMTFASKQPARVSKIITEIQHPQSRPKTA